MADLPEGEPFDPDDLAGRARPAEPARGVPLAALRGGRGDRAGRQPADHRARRGPPAALDRRRRHLLDDRRPRRLGLLGASQPVPPRPSGCASRPASTGSASIDLDEFSYQVGVDFTKPGVWTPDTNFVAGVVGVQPRVRDLPPEGRRGERRPDAAVQPAADRQPAGAGVAVALRGRLRHPRVHHPGAARQRRLRPAQRSARRHARLLCRRDPPAVLRVRVRQRRGARHARGARLPELRRGGQAHPGRAGAGRQLRRRVDRGKPAGPAVLRRRRRLGARLCLPVDRHRQLRVRGRGDRGRRARACSRPRPSCATASPSAGAGSASSTPGS